MWWLVVVMRSCHGDIHVWDVWRNVIQHPDRYSSQQEFLVSDQNTQLIIEIGFKCYQITSSGWSYKLNEYWMTKPKLFNGSHISWDFIVSVFTINIYQVWISYELRHASYFLIQVVTSISHSQPTRNTLDIKYQI